MKKLHIEYLAIEVTRRCNMSCAHCMRGEAQDCDIDTAYIDAVLSQLDSIGTITFTGGEPTLNLAAIRHTLNACEQRSIPVNNFYLVTNGKQVEKEFLMLMLDWWAYTDGDDDLSAVSLSIDEYHEPIPYRNRALLRGLGFFNMVDHNRTGTNALLDLGRAREVQHVGKVERWLFEPTVEEDDDTVYLHESSITLTCHGDILPVSDYEYAEDKTLAIGRAETFARDISCWAGLINEHTNYGLMFMPAAQTREEAIPCWT